MVAGKAGILKRQMDLLEEQYDQNDHPANVVMDHTKPMQKMVRRLAAVADSISAAAVQ
jgi:hypothetical protein